MGLFRRSAPVDLAVSPPLAVLRQTVTATVTGSVDRVRSARLDWGYTNFFRHRWAGHADSAAAQLNDDLWLLGEVGTNYGGDRDTEEWVSVTAVDLPIATGELTGGSYDFKVPSWAPASSREIARWSCRLTVDREGPDVEARGDFTVVVRPEDADAGDEPMERYDGSGETVIEITLPSPVYAAGQVVRGQITLTPTTDVPDGDLGVSWQRHRESHPLTGNPCTTAPVDGPIVKLGQGIRLRAGVPTVVPFDLVLPEDAAPTAAAVHSSMSWFIRAELFCAGSTGHMTERVRKPIVVVNAVGQG
ncbi:hypothetical protein [Candidatus Mycolicibacterium alkanivorans]|uniref:Arrestin-like N-terminal domain-containing protein n=1 Tax=Candidatus Mycolicibacterium alkanivorans TaxID=2954114 RepID=A0ABS9YU68_9MYCO|nr:hypothetical protein [Candidatus Mycolicibacterium alkanivorans]MCI4674730.1 hypothetical protein [Candidatus Mycolicibacterium alkanivorans]